MRQHFLLCLPTPLVQGLPAWHTNGLGCSRFARHYYGNTFCSSGYMRCFSSPGALRANSTVIVSQRWGCPIRRSWDQCLLTAPPRLSQLCHVLHRHAAPRHPPSAHTVFPAGRPSVDDTRSLVHVVDSVDDASVCSRHRRLHSIQNTLHLVRYN